MMPYTDWTPIPVTKSDIKGLKAMLNFKECSKSYCNNAYQMKQKYFSPVLYFVIFLEPKYLFHT